MTFKILSLALNIPGPLVCQRLANLGMDVLKIEPPQGDLLQSVCAEWYLEIHQAQTVVVQDLKTDEGQIYLQEQLSQADLLITSSRSQTLDRMGLQRENLNTEFSDLSHLAIYGELSPRDNVPGHDLTYQAQAGLIADTKHLPRSLLADQMGAEMALSAALHLLLQKEKTGQAGYHEVSLAVAAQSLAKPFQYGMTTPKGVLGGKLAQYALYQASDGYVALAALENKFIETLTTQLELQEFTFESLKKVFIKRKACEWETWALEHDVPLVAVKNFRGTS